ncbi:MAG: zinc ABC transporter ATP-binding protein ZnuC [Candidatus Thiodiazotropha sp. (ex Lucinoma aequizonata)]|nr:zinc ABC transporter ATP-binding protein ZnuC [Candidatus Thiodiazotropha sp. (ex Lucinoma aequizonata)]MCU7889336.1 zinc ABC transporter ATP-binding protein ZnuC [Candidatus Thiodiazotropha sp. (ex Lucinoma aequizonata)]MCU7896247.1 zinc ABC transporter ATP-binding protein ZnuC [Candidatus Thiodiazotropha sp. (ex Lucinoma aequizonata)]MCU7898366.1 zinc ABC transporter ATP-binding protein ZnuC [Candidatus Thiodiazotropha sp. (ex Lucinoma aequizonata)]MCU7902684.1 zinc ABC transporter ATP-bin
MNRTGKVLIEANDISIALQGRQVLEQVNLAVHQGEIVTLIGPNGSGKTTLVRIILGLLKADGGRIKTQPGLRIGYMPQRLVLSENMPLTVKRFLSLGNKGQDSEMQLILNELAIEQLLDSPMQRLSGGELQRILLARALLRKPDLMVFDEPVQGVDVTGQAALYALITQIRDQFGCGVLMISHDLHLVMATTDQVLCLNHHVCCSGHPKSISQHPAYLELFGSPANAKLAIYTHHHDHTHDIHGDVKSPQKEHHHG